MTTKSITSPMTEDQSRSIIQLVSEVGGEALNHLGLDRGRAQGLIENAGDFKRSIREPLTEVIRQYIRTNPWWFVKDWFAEWQRFYRDNFNREVDFSHVPLSAPRPGFDWPVMMAPGLTLNEVWTRCKDRFPCYSFIGDDLDAAVTFNERTPEKAYAVGFRGRVEADEENKGFSANDLVTRKVSSIVLRERCVMELWYNEVTGGGHLDIKRSTLCAGSRDSGGDVPSADWCGGEFRVGYYRPDDASDYLRSRSVV